MTVLVVGAGPSGLTLACALRQRDVDVRVVDAAAGPATTSRALALMPRGVEVLTRLGALGDLPRRAVQAMNTTVYSAGAPLLSMRLSDPDGDPSVYFVSQAEVERALRDRLAHLGGVIEWNTEVTGVDAESDGVTAHFADRTLRLDWVVGCDGAHSAVRKAAGIGFPGAPVVERFLLADVVAALPLDHDGAAVWLGHDGLFMAFPLPGSDRWRLMADVPSVGDDIIGRLRELLAARANLADARIGQVEWTSVFRIHRRLATAYRRGRLLLAGDAAHIHSPLGGQGMNTGIGDAENLAWKLTLVCKGLADDHLLDTYQAERRPVAGDVVADTTRATRFLLSGNPVTRVVRNRLVLPALRKPGMQRLLRAAASQLAVSYWGGPLAPNDEAGPARKLLARVPRRRDVADLRDGDRVPPIRCVLPDGSAGTLHAAQAGRWALLVPPGAMTPEIDHLGAELVVLHADVPGAVLVRPDAHVAWQERNAAEGVNARLEKILGPGPVVSDSPVSLTDRHSSA